MKWLPYILIAALTFGLGWCSRSPNGNIVGKTDTIISVNVVTKIDVDTQYILFPVPYLAWIDNTDTIRIGDSCWHLREYKEYQDSSYYARVSGVQPRLDEIKVYPKTIYQTEYIYRDIYHKKKRWGFGPCVSWGIGPNGKPQFVLGLSVQYSLLQW